MSIEVYISDVTVLKNDILYNYVYNMLPEGNIWSERKKKIDSYRFYKDKYLSLGAGMYLLYFMKKYGIDINQLRQNAYGKLYIENAEFYFNLSHCGKYVVASEGMRENGIDIEESQILDLELANHFFNEDEYDKLLQQVEEHSFSRIWTLKECYIKTLGKGLSIPLNSFVARLGELKRERSSEFSHICSTSYVCNSDINFKEFYFDGYNIAVGGFEIISDVICKKDLFEEIVLLK